jgi:ribose 5-phosphate isomerase RpiB
MRVLIGADSSGFELREAIRETLVEKGYDLTNATPQAVPLYLYLL